MKITRIQNFIFILFAVLFTNEQLVVAADLSNQCLDCICYAISGCNVTLGCDGDSCGIFRITQPYWVDADKPLRNKGDENSGQAYSNCVTDVDCAGQTVRNYMYKYSQDCNGDGKVDCTDYAAIHKYGRTGCTAPLLGDYKKKIDACTAYLT